MVAPEHLQQANGLPATAMAFNPVGYAIWGPIAAAIGIEPALWVAAALLMASILPLLAIREVRELPATIA